MHSHRLLLTALVLLLGSRSGAPQSREPIRVGSNVQESKLVHRVGPVYPAEARAERVAGAVILRATIDEAGQVADVDVLRGHPLLDAAAVDAVRQWRYAPTHLNGQAVQVIASVTVFFPDPVSVTVSEDGSVSETGSALTGAPLDEKLGGAPRVIVNPAADVPQETLARVVERLERQGVADIQLRGGFVSYEGRLFYDSTARGVRPPDLALDLKRLEALARRELAEQRVNAVGRMGYQLFVNEVGEVTGVRPLHRLKLEAVEDELRRTRVVTPGRRGADPVPTMVPVLIGVE